MLTMNNLNLKEHEETFEVRPIGIRYKCEICGKGEQKLDVINKPQLLGDTLMYIHRCTVCSGMMSLPKQYPYIEWVPVENMGETKNETD